MNWETEIDDQKLESLSNAVRRGDPGEATEEMKSFIWITSKARSVLERRDLALGGSKETDSILGCRKLLKAMSMLADAHYLVGEFKASSDLLEAASSWILKFFMKKRTSEELHSWRRVKRQQMWLISGHAAALIRLGELKLASKNLSLTERFVLDHVRDAATFPCHGTLARITFYKGLLARNSGLMDEARNLFDQAVEAAVARRDEVMADLKKSKEHRRAEELFAKRCLARVQAFGFGVTALCEGRLRRARAAFYFALELLRRAEGDQEHLYHDELMAKQIVLFLTLVRVMIVRFDDDGLRQLDQMESSVEVLASWFSRRKEVGTHEPDLMLARSLVRFSQLRKAQISQVAGLLQVELSPSNALPPLLRNDLTVILSRIVDIWVALDINPRAVLDAARSLKTPISFLKEEIDLAKLQARTQLGESKEVIDDIIKLPRRRSLTRGQQQFLKLIEAEAWLWIANNVDSRMTDDARTKSWVAGTNARDLAIELEDKRHLTTSGILRWKIQRLAANTERFNKLPDLLPTPESVNYPDASMDLCILIARHNAIVKIIQDRRLRPGEAKAWSQIVSDLKMARRSEDSNRTVFDAFPYLRPFIAKGNEKDSEEVAEAQAFLDWLRHRR